MTEILVTAGGAAAIAALTWFFFGARQGRSVEPAGDRQQVELIEPAVAGANGGGAPDEVELALQPGGISCASCVARIEGAVLALPGVDRAAVNMATERVTIDYDPGRLGVGQLREAIVGAGYELRNGNGRVDEMPDGDEDALAEARREEIADLSRRVAIGAVPTAPVLFAVMAMDVFDAGWVPEILLNHWLQLALIAPVMFYAGWPIHRTGWLTLSHRGADMNSLIAIGTAAAFGYSPSSPSSRACFPRTCATSTTRRSA
jgi:Cu+-exporting ATPase